MGETHKIEESDPVGSRQRHLTWPATKFGRWSVALAATFIVLFAINAAVLMSLRSEATWVRMVMIFYGFAMLLCGLAAGVVGLMAVLRQRERSWLVWLCILPGLFVVFLVLGELLTSH